ncbi:MAG TPA: histone deacetylase family protein, partial [Micavibrio sp.]
MTFLTLYIPSQGLEHQTGRGHPESPERLAAILSLLDKAPFNKLSRVQPEEAPLKAIKRAHDSRYLDRLEESIPDYGQTHIDGDTVLSPGSYAAALTAAGAVCQAVDDIIDAKTTRAFCAV